MNLQETISFGFAKASQDKSLSFYMIKIFCFAKASQDKSLQNDGLKKFLVCLARVEPNWNKSCFANASQDDKKPCYVLQTSQGGGGVGGVRTLVQTMGIQAFYMLIS